MLLKLSKGYIVQQLHLGWLLLLKQGLETSISRRLCLTCLCSTVALINISSSSVSGPKAIASEAKERAVCRNCGGNGAVICKFRNSLFVLFVSCLHFVYILYNSFCRSKTVRSLRHRWSLTVHSIL
mgnify:CR=1 FL=1